MIKVIAGLSIIAFVAVFMFDGCGGGDSTPPFYTVNAGIGNDTTGDGVTKPYKTITKALSMANPGDTVTVAPGTYDNVLGEIFPIVIPSGVKLIGDEANKGDGPTPTMILVGGEEDISDMVFVGSNATIAGFAMQSNSLSTLTSGVIMGGYHPTVKNNRIVGFTYSAISVAYVYAEGVISGNVIQNNRQGIMLNPDTGEWIRIENNVITSNDLGVSWSGGFSDSVSVDLGGGPGGSVGGNVIAGNKRIDLYIPIANPLQSKIYARNNFWDHVPPTVSNLPEDGADIVNVSGIPIDYTGAALAPSPSP